MLSAVLFTDGSARPNPGNAGWGIHGYIYDATKKPKKPKQLDKKYITNVGYVDEIKDDIFPVDPISYINAYGSFDHNEYDSLLQTSALAEIYAIKMALELINDKEVEYTLLISDSEYALGIARDIRKIANRNFLKSTGEKYTHESIIRSIYDQFNIMLENNRHIDYKWVKGHSGVLGNVLADKSAFIGMSYGKDNKYVTQFLSTKTNTLTPIKKNPLICLPRVYFFSKPSFDDTGVYYMTGYPYTGKDDYVLGKRTSDAIFSIMYTDKPDPILEVSKQRHRKISGDYNKIIMLDVDNLYSASSISDYGLYGSYFITPERKNGVSSMLSTNRDLISVDQVPPNLAYKAVTVFHELMIILKTFIEFMDDPTKALPPDLEIKDITDTLYEVNNKKTQLLKSLDNNTPVKAHGIGIFKFKLDMPSRDVFKKIEGENPTVYMGQSVIDGVVYIRFSIIKSNLGVQIYSNRYAHKVSDVMNIKMK